MIWNKPVYDSLTQCAALCDQSATEFSRAENIEVWYRLIFLSLDCADICRQVGMLYVRGSENTQLLAQACIDVCEKCAQEAANFDQERCHQISAICQQTIASCIKILGMATRSDDMFVPATNSRSLFYGIDLRETIYN